MKTRLLIFAACAAAAGHASAAYIFTGSNPVITEDFNGVPTTTQTAFFSTTTGSQTLVTGSGFEGTKLAGTGTTGASLFANFGDSNSGGVHSLGVTSDPERALGLLASGTNIMGMGFRLTNDLASGQIITAVTIAFTQEIWRSSTSTQNIMAAGFGTTDTGVLDASFISSATGISAATTLDLTGPAPIAANGALDGNSILNQTIRTETFSGLSLAPGESFYLRWQDVNDTGNDADLAIDGMTITIAAAAVPEPSTALLAAGLGLLALRRRR